VAKRPAVPNGWTVRRAATTAPRGRRGVAAAAPDVPPMFLQGDGVRVVDAFEAVPSDARRAAAPPDLALDVPLNRGEQALLAIRHPSGALTFHPSSERTSRGAGVRTPGAGVARFRVPVRRAVDTSERRGVDAVRRGPIAKAIKVVVVKVGKAAVDKAVSIALPRLAAMWEARVWTRRKLQEGWFRVTPSAGAASGLDLTAELPQPGERSLLLVHGTFSNAAGAYGDLARTDFFTRVQGLYDGRIYAYNHFSVSRTPDENAAMLLRDLQPKGEYQFDAVTHSRGGLVLRSLVEHRSKHGALADRFQLRRAVLVASPNEGTPLATPTRWEETVGWFANVMELFPDNPFTTGAEFVSEALVWLASHLSGDLPGLRAMDATGELVTDLQTPPGPPADAYSALVSNVHPEGELWQRALDVGVDAFFASANDLVVPSEGGWRIDRDGTAYVPASRIGCFGPGGNIDSGPNQVNHVNFFSRPETAVFLARALAGEGQSLTAIDPSVPLPDRRFPTGRRGAAAALTTSTPTTTVPIPTAAAAATGSARVQLQSALDDVEAFHIVIMDSDDSGQAVRRKAKRRAGDEGTDGVEKDRPRFARVFATYGGARVTTPMRLRAEPGEEPTRFGKIIAVHERIKRYTNRVEGTLPSDADMIEFGSDLFETLFQGDVRRLYDEARARQEGRKLDLVLTSMIPWIAEKPWEFAYDAGRQSFLATEEIHFVRNVLTSIPADEVKRCQGALRILVASAQPVGFGHLSIDQEVEVIRRGFQPLEDAGVATVEVLPRATPGAIHARLSREQFQVLHFIGHGVFDEATQEGCLVFEDDRGGAFNLGQRSVREIFCKRGLNLVFLNACQSASGGRSDFNKGVAQALVSHGLPALVANQYSVLDSSATSFAQQFYWCLAQGLSLGAAAREARIAVNYSLQGELIDWAVPVLYARDPNSALCARTERPAPVLAMNVRATSRRATAGRPVRVGVWDIDDVFPSLDRTLARMNAVQQLYGFELVDLSVPLDAWDVDNKADDNAPYLWAEKFVKRLQSKTVELRLNVLACVTRHWLRDNDTFKLYGWWPPRHQPPIVIFSCAGFTNMAAEGPTTDRAIANAMVSALGGYFGELELHQRGAKDCPFAFSPTRNLKHLTSAQTFDAACRRKLAERLPKELPALEALLTAFV
jgi:hypothetical protein